MSNPVVNPKWAGDLDCSVCRRKRLIAAEFSKAQVLKYRKSGGTCTITCKVCTAKEEEQRQSKSAQPKEDDGTLHLCSSCAKMLPASSFKRNQLMNKGPGKQRCMACVTAALKAEDEGLAKKVAEVSVGGASKGDKLREACKEVAKEAELVTGLKPMVLGKGGGRGKWRRGGGGGGRGGRGGGRGRGKSNATLLSIVCILVAIINVVTSQQPSAWDVYPPDLQGTFSTKVDHYNFQKDVERFDLNYAGYSKFADKTKISDGGVPVFLYCGNEGPIDSFYNASGSIFTMAEEFGAIVMFIEHRYYGGSLPYGDQSFDSGKMHHLTIEQALADYAAFIDELDKILPVPTLLPILFGGSYGGMLAAWHRYKYPHLSLGAVASGAPIDFYPNEGVQELFYDAFIETYETSSPGCGSALDSIVSSLLPTLTTKDILNSNVVPCGSVTTQSFWSYALGAISTMACVDYPYPTGFIAPMPGNPVQVACEKNILSRDSSGSDGGLDVLVDVINMYVNYTGALECMDFESEIIGGDDEGVKGLGRRMRQYSKGSHFKESDLGVTSWNYQACTELILEPITSDGFGFYPPDDGEGTEGAVAKCADIFDVETDPFWMGVSFGRGKDYTKYLTNTIIMENSRDPWRVGTLSIEENRGNGLYKYMADGGAHHQDLRFADDLDSDGVKSARRFESDVIREWIANA